jgi:hypothetical protein
MLSALLSPAAALKTMWSAVPTATTLLRQLFFKVGDLVWVSTAHLPRNLGDSKPYPVYLGPFRVTSHLAPDVYQVGFGDRFPLHILTSSSTNSDLTSSPPSPEARVQTNEIYRLLGTNDASQSPRSRPWSAANGLVVDPGWMANRTTSIGSGISDLIII